MVTTVITSAEIEYGIARLADGRRRTNLAQRFETLIGPDFGFSVLPLDEPAARLAGHFRHQREVLGLSAQFPDMMIAGIALRIEAAIATRNVGDFSDIGVEIINLWD
ncbi:MAG: PIN domain-containing protein [Proteobacteria bacterium]|nr:PIN domain-containing protein [Pseudomonadota bacterium]